MDKPPGGDNADNSGSCAVYLPFEQAYPPTALKYNQCSERLFEAPVACWDVYFYLLRRKRLLKSSLNLLQEMKYKKKLIEQLIAYISTVMA
jgi:hypothetical protein